MPAASLLSKTNGTPSGDNTAITLNNNPASPGRVAVTNRVDGQQHGRRSGPWIFSIRHSLQKIRDRDLIQPGQILAIRCGATDERRRLCQGDGQVIESIRHPVGTVWVVDSSATRQIGDRLGSVELADCDLIAKFVEGRGRSGDHDLGASRGRDEPTHQVGVLRVVENKQRRPALAFQVFAQLSRRLGGITLRVSDSDLVGCSGQTGDHCIDRVRRHPRDEWPSVVESDDGRRPPRRATYPRRVARSPRSRPPPGSDPLRPPTPRQRVARRSPAALAESLRPRPAPQQSPQPAPPPSEVAPPGAPPSPRPPTPPITRQRSPPAACRLRPAPSRSTRRGLLWVNGCEPPPRPSRPR